MTTSERLMKAKELLVRDGWMTKFLRGNMNYNQDPSDFRRCALGCVFDAAGVIDYHSNYACDLYGDTANRVAIQYLVKAIPKDFKRVDWIFESSPSKVAIYNNAQRDVTVVLAWFDRAIELAQAAEMHRELESTVPVVAEREEEVKGELVRA